MINPATIPSQMKDSVGDGRWISQHERFLDDCKRHEPNIVFIGDCLIQQMQNSTIWKTNLEPLHCLNFGIDDDQTQHVLWRIKNGELDFENKPKIVVLLVGTNNNDHTADQVAEGIITIVASVREKLPQSHIIILAIPPRGRDINSVREKINRVNDTVEQSLKNGTITDKRIHFLCSSKVHEFISPQDGTISHTDMYDYLHFTDQGYFKLMEPVLDEIIEILSLYDS
ncbi:platelet-activating factor acetylhydrolase IB subunit gamma [Brachionus plicatilis]|uniref:Platelet-activating factor acetylhydrolase IB subunit gamma n=1 Tax=Brachionus plicatilis TaxID=10195 RepID=A0A3M7QSW2_BRAPC|nr:platelet-activating factor acetylhydrolase IB subunit gamma [Brachionus plicatilis]